MLTWQCLQDLASLCTPNLHCIVIRTWNNFRAICRQGYRADSTTMAWWQIHVISTKIDIIINIINIIIIIIIQKIHKKMKKLIYTYINTYKKNIHETMLTWQCLQDLVSLCTPNLHCIVIRTWNNFRAICRQGYRADTTTMTWWQIHVITNQLQEESIFSKECIGI